MKSYSFEKIGSVFVVKESQMGNYKEMSEIGKVIPNARLSWMTPSPAR